MWLQIGKQLYFQLRLVGICKNPFSNSSKRWIICLTSALEWLSIHLSTCLLRYLGGESEVALSSWGTLHVSGILFGEGNGNPLQYSCLENPMDGGAWWAAVHGVAKSRGQLSDFIFTFHFRALENEMATHSSIFVWRMPGREEPSRLPSMGSHRVGHGWSDLTAGILFCPLELMPFHYSGPGLKVYLLQKHRVKAP